MKRVLLFLATAGAGLLPVAAVADSAVSCSSNRAVCEAVCTPAKVARYYFGVAERCTASCEPRWQQCLRTGIWVHLEDQYPGWHQPVTRF